MEKDAKIALIGNNKRGPEVELMGPHGNGFIIFITDDDGDIVALKPGQARALIGKLTEALTIVATVRSKHYGYLLNRKEMKR